jgi:hypothetical protein
MSDIARVYAPGQEPAKATTTLAVQFPPGQEKASQANQHNGHDYRDDRTK